MFSFNSPHGWCPECRGFGEVWKQSVNPRLESVLEQEMDIDFPAETHRAMHLHRNMGRGVGGGRTAIRALVDAGETAAAA